MLAPRPAHSTTVMTLVFAVLAALLIALPTAMPPAALAQTPGCSGSAGSGPACQPAPAQGRCGATVGSMCGSGCGVSTVPMCGSGFSSPFGCVGASAACGTSSLSGCSSGSLGAVQSCGNGSGCGATVLVPGSCGLTSGCSTGLFGAPVSCAGGPGSCIGRILSAGQSCSNGVITCSSGTTCAPPTGQQNCPTTATTPQCTAAATLTSPTSAATGARPALPSARNVTCPGGGFVPVGTSCSSDVPAASLTASAASETPPDATASLSTPSAAVEAAVPAATVLVVQSATLGPILTDPQGMTLYMRTTDPVGGSDCTSECAATWPPLLAASASLALPEGATGTLAVITREDGSQQVSYDGMALYHYQGDAAVGDTNGHGVDGIWSVATP